jgi:hypothetical protein
MPAAQGGTRQPGPKVNVFHLKLIGVAGRQFWDCRSNTTLLTSLAIVLPWRLAYRLVRAEFRFEQPPTAGLMKKFGLPTNDPALVERLRDGGLLAELASLRSGSNPYLPKVSFNPRAQVIGEGIVAAYESRLREAARAHADPALESALAGGFRAAEREHPGELAFQVEAGRTKVPSEERFRELLDGALRVARINAEAN